MYLKKIILWILPSAFLSFFHTIKAYFACFLYGNPSADLLVIGITGTKGKSTTANFLWAALQGANMQTGLIGTANIRIGNKELMNPYHMTMPSPMIIQKLFKQMKKAGCKAVVMEVTSEGLKQHRHLGIHFSAGVFTNLSPEHLPSHNNSYEEYAKAKRIFFEYLPQDAVAVFNADDEKSVFFQEAFAGKKITTSFHNKGDVNAVLQTVSPEKTDFIVSGKEQYSIIVGGNKNAENALLAVAVAQYFGATHQEIQNGFSRLSVIAGRMEKIDAGQNFTVFVDYAHEEKSMRFILETGNLAKKGNKLIVLLGAEGGGRDPRKRAIMGKLVGEQADMVIVSNVDPYEDDPTAICEDIARASENAGKIKNKNLWVIEDRKAGIEKALSLANEGDVVFITGKGSEQSITLGGKSFPWDDRKVVKEALASLLANK